MYVQGQQGAHLGVTVLPVTSLSSECQFNVCRFNECPVSDAKICKTQPLSSGTVF